MNGAKINIAAMPVGEQFTLSGEEAQNVKFVRVLETKPSKAVDRTGAAVVPQPYAQMRLGPISFTINTQEDIDQVSTRENRDEIESISLEVSEFDDAEIDDNGNAVLDDQQNPIMRKRRGLAFVGLRTWAQKQKLALRGVSEAGAIHAAKVKYGLPTEVTNVASVAQELKKLLKEEEAVVK